MSVRTRARGNVLLIQLQGPLVGGAVDTVRMYLVSTLARQVPPLMVVDIAGLTLMEEAGLEVLRSATRHARNEGGRLVVTGGQHLLGTSTAGLDVMPTIRDAFFAPDGSGESPPSLDRRE
ncbi:STAS domain-containing protein [Nonomuraea sp. B12E4]|uniref:STAS domain-containing protein n=1 Tax=Nonomuraea sp. B12E4 TaxID=3153564 RepID=UPI00325D24A3